MPLLPSVDRLQHVIMQTAQLNSAKMHPFTNVMWWLNNANSVVLSVLLNYRVLLAVNSVDSDRDGLQSEKGESRVFRLNCWYQQEAYASFFDRKRQTTKI